MTKTSLVFHGSFGLVALVASQTHQTVPEQLLISEKLYGRELGVDTLLEAFDRVAYRGRPELVLVSGYSGIGKSAVVNELHKYLVPPRGLFASGKFDPYEREPMSAEECLVSLPAAVIGSAAERLGLKPRLETLGILQPFEAGIDHYSRYRLQPSANVLPTA
jgi:hypothetical protein